MGFDHRARIARTSNAAATDSMLGPGKRTLTEQLPVQRREDTPWHGADPGTNPAQVHAAAMRGTATPATKLPYADQIQRAFGRHDISGIQTHMGADAAESAREIGAQAFATGDHVVLGEGADLRTVAHEAAHVVQQRGEVRLKGGVGEAADEYERQADEVADRVVQGESAERLLDAATSASGKRGAATHEGTHPIARSEVHTGGGGPTRDASAPVQCMKFRDNGKAIGPLEEEPKDAHDTEQIDAFNSWLLKQNPQVLNAVYRGLLDSRSPTRGEAIARSRIQQLMDSGGQQLGQANNSLGELRKDDWWKLFIDRGAHRSSETRSQNAMRFDRESSPGYYDAMMQTYDQVLAPIEPGQRQDLGSGDLIKIHEMVTDRTLTKNDDDFEPTPHALSGEGTTFPMTKKEGEVPSAIAFEELAKEGVIGMHPMAKQGYKAPIGENDSPELRYRKRATQASPENPMTVMRPLGNNLVDTQYKRKDATEIMDHLLETYYKERSEADEIENDTARDNAKLRAIARVIRGLHTAHVFTDANGRLNTMVLLNKFLLEEGFDPAIMDDTSMFGGGFSIEQLVGQIRRGMTTFSQEARGGNESWGTARRAYTWFTYAEDDHPSDSRVALLHVIKLDVGKIPLKYETKVAEIMKRFRAKAYSTTTQGPTITRLGFKSSMDALLLENELETLVHD